MNRSRGNWLSLVLKIEADFIAGYSPRHWRKLAVSLVNNSRQLKMSRQLMEHMKTSLHPAVHWGIDVIVGTDEEYLFTMDGQRKYIIC